MASSSNDGARPPKKTMVAPGPRPPAPPPTADPARARRREAAETRIAPAHASRPTADPGGRETAQRSAATVPLGRDGAADERRTTSFRVDRDQKVGANIAGTEGLLEAGSEAPRIRLQAGKPVPGTRYILRRWLGEGGMGVVYEAEHMDIERRVALKILRFDLSQQAHMAQVFRDEARAASRIGSEYIVEIFDFGELPDGRLWFCMELLDGSDLVPEDEEISMDPARLIGLMRMVCKGLDRAHTQGIVHRDIKPENILTVHQGRREVVKIVDFGISAMLAAGQQGGSVAGTPHYMPPEQVLGQPFDGRCDMYALGATAYELLCGHPPFMSEELEEILDMQVNAAPPPLDQQRRDVELPKALCDVVMRCLAKDPAERYADMKDLEAALCEAQIALGLQTPWDDLELPEVDETRRARLLEQMPSPLSPMGDRRRSWLWPAVAAGSALVAGAAIFFALNAKPSEDELAQIEALTAEARAAGSRTHWVYPPFTDRESPTSYVKVRALEDLPGKLDAPGDERAEALRKEFAQALLNLGDQFWDVEETRPIARDYYWQAALFEPGNDRALERSGVTPGFLAEQSAKALAMQFTEAEIKAARQQVYLAQMDRGETFDPEESALIFADADAGSMIQGRQLARAMRAKGIKAPPGSKLPDEGDDGAGGDAGAAEDGDEAGAEDTAGEGGDEAGAQDGAEGGEDPSALVLEEVANDRPSLGSRRGRTKRRRPSGGGGEDAGLGKGERDPARAQELASQGNSALRAGRRGEAEKLFNQAISFDNRNAAALMGLSDVYFDTGKNQKAVMYAERAVKAASKNGNYRLKLGDAYFKVLRYKDALEQYEKAKSLGNGRAQSRIDKVKGKIG